MALIKCTECGKEFSDKAQTCPNCGCPTSEIKNQELKQEEKKEPEFELQLENDYSIKISSDDMQLFYKNGFILESDVREFILNWMSEEEELGRKQLKVVFSHPGYKKPLKLMVNATSERYEKAQYFVVNVVEKYFKKDICNNYFEAGLYAEKHVDNVLFRKAYENEKKIIEENQQSFQNQSVSQNIQSNHAINNTPIQNMPVQSEPKKKKRGCCGSIVWVLIIFAVISFLTNKIDKNKNQQEEENGTDWATTETSLSDFEYYVNGDQLHITEYVGENKKVKISPEYDEGIVTSLENAAFLFSDATSVIVPENVTSMESNVFNSCDVEYIYLPSTLKNVDDYFWGYFHDVKELYYGGTQEQWDKICHVARGDLDVEEIYCNVNIESLGTEEAKSTPIVMPEVVEEEKNNYVSTPEHIIEGAKHAVNQHDEFISDASAYLSIDISEKLYNILFDDIGFSEIEFLGKDEAGDSIWNITCDGIGIMVTASDDVYMIWSGDYTFYNSGVTMTKAQFEAAHVKESDKTTYYAIAQGIVLEYLKSPNSANFPWGTSDIGFGKNGDVIAVQGYVDAMNSFGAMLRSQWTVEFRVTDVDSLSYETIYVNIDGESYGTYVEMN